MKKTVSKWSCAKGMANNSKSRFRTGLGKFAASLMLVSYAGMVHAADHVFGVTAALQESPAKITLTWDADDWNSSPTYTIYRKLPSDTSWTQITQFSTANTFSYDDTTVSIGTEYEYRINREDLDPGHEKWNEDTYISTGIKTPLIDNRGAVVLVVDNRFTLSLAAELSRLQTDLVGDGWKVIRHDVDVSSTSASSIRSQIATDYDAANSNPNNVKTVLLFGHIPVVKSGDYNPDGHSTRAFPTDLYYGDVDGTWTKANPSDTYFEQDMAPSAVELQVGRVDMYDMTGTGGFFESEEELLRRYLDKNHDWRHKVFSVPNKMAQMKADSGTAFQRQFFGRGSGAVYEIPEHDYLDDTYSVTNSAYLWFSKGTGGGSPDGDSTMGATTADLASSPGINVVFNTFFASFYLEWDAQNNFLRAPLAARGYALCNAWSDYPGWAFHHMGMGSTIGYSTRISQNNHNSTGSSYDLYNIPHYGGSLPDLVYGAVHMNLMGDPTLRMHVVPPPSNVGIGGAVTGVTVSWTASPTGSGVMGYNLYKASSVDGSFTKVNSSIITGTSFNDTAGTPSMIYMVRALKLEDISTGASGSYTNASEGIMSAYAINIDFGLEDTVSPKVGLAAAGESSHDFWNMVGPEKALGGPFSISDLRTADGNYSGVSFTVNDVDSFGTIGASDAMFSTYRTSGGGADMVITIDNLAPGYYDIYAYGHHGLDAGNGIFDIGGVVQATSDSSGWNASTWQEGKQYVRFQNVQAVSSESLVITVVAGVLSQPFINGLQVIKK